MLVPEIWTKDSSFVFWKIMYSLYKCLNTVSPRYLWTSYHYGVLKHCWFRL